MHIWMTIKDELAGAPGSEGLSLRRLCPCISATVVALTWLLLLSVLPALADELPKKLLHLSFEDEAWVAFSKSRSTALVDYPNFADGKKGRGAHHQAWGVWQY